MTAHKWAELAQQVGQQFAATLGDQPAVETLWISEDDYGIELWLVTAPTEPAVTRRLQAAEVLLQRQFPEPEIRLHVLNRRNFPDLDRGVTLPESAHLVARFAACG
jgi:hypothetical protein